MSYIAHAAHVDLCLGDAERELLGSRVGTGPGDLTRKRLYLLRMEQTERLSAWRSAFLAARARPRVVCGPVLASAFVRLALILRSLVTPHFPLRLAAARVLIPNPIDQNPWAHWRSPMDMMRQG